MPAATNQIPLPVAGQNCRDQEPEEPQVDVHSYDHVIVAFSGGKDSAACVLHLLELGVDPDKIELWHHEVDGREGSKLMDWPCTTGYVKRFADDFGMDLYFSWKTGGFEREMLRENQRTASIRFEKPNGEVGESGGTRGSKSTRRLFPQVSADLSVRWCSAYLKIDVAASALRNDHRFREKRTLVVTGERAEESASRAKYATLEPHKADLRDGKRYTRHIDHWRPVHGWSEQQVWDALERWRVDPHPAYKLGWGRVSCAACIFGNDNQWASLAAVNPDQVLDVAAYEEEFDTTIHRDLSVMERVERGDPYDAIDPEIVEQALDEDYDYLVRLPEGEWEEPAGAFGESAGPV